MSSQIKTVWPHLEERLMEHFRSEINAIIDIIIEQAKADLVEQVREKTGAMAAKILSGFDYRHDSHRLVITVNFNNLSEPT